MPRKLKLPTLNKILTEKDIKAYKETLFALIDVKNIYEARRRYNVKTAKEAYDLLLKDYNDFIIGLNQKETEKYNKKVAKKKKYKLNILEEAEEEQGLPNFDDDLFDIPEQKVKVVKKPYKVQIHIKFKRFWKKNEVFEKYDLDDYPEPVVIIARDEEDLNEKVKNYVETKYPYETDYYKDTLISFDYEIVQQLKNNKIKKIDVPMKRAFPFKASFLKHAKNISPISYENHNGECVLKTLSKHLQIKEQIVKHIFNEASLKYYKRKYKKKHGITSRMILYLCRERNISCYGYDQTENVFVKHSKDRKLKGKNYKAIAFYMLLNHFYLITGDALKSISEIEKNNNTYKTDISIEDEKETENITFISANDFYNEDEDNELDDEDDDEPILECKCFYEIEKILNLPSNSCVIFEETNLNKVFNEIVKLTNDIPKVKFNSYSTISEIVLENKNKLVINGSYSEGLEWKTIYNICEKQNIPFTNQSLGTLLNQLKNKYYNNTRVRFTKDQREYIKTRQDGLCNECCDELDDKYHIDHITPLSAGGTNDENNLQALCVSCHIEKTRMEKENGEHIHKCEFMSAFNIQAFNAVNTNHFRKVAFTKQILNEDEIYFYENEMGYKKYSIDMNKCRRNIFIHSKNNYCVYSVLDNIEVFDGKLTDGFYYIESENEFPLRRNGFYSLPMVNYCLQQNIITLDNIIYQYKPSFTIEPKYFINFVNHLLEVFKDDEKLQKLSINTLIGLFGRRKNEFVKHQVCNKESIDEIGCAIETLGLSANPYIMKLNDELTAITGKYKINKLESYFPLHAQIVDIEALELHKLKNTIEANDGVAVCLKTDCVSYVAKDKIDIDNFYWDEEKQIKKYKNEKFSIIKHEVNVNNYEKFVLEKISYKYIEENDDFDVIVDNILASNQGLLITGSAGTGKTTLINKIISNFEEDEIIRLTPTNVSALLIDGITLDKFAHNFINGKKKYGKIKYIFVDEISMVRELFYNVLLSIKLMYPHIKFIISGHFSQLPPVKDKVNKQSYSCKIYENSNALYELVDGNKLQLTKCRRSDDRLFNICNQLEQKKDISIKPFQQKQFTFKNLCFTNEKRKEINKKCMIKYIQQHKPKRTLPIEKLHYDKNSQDFTLCEGMPIISRITSRKLNIVNNEIFKVVKIGKDFIKIKNEIKELEIPTNKINRCFYLAFCMTIHKSQGATYHEKYTIYEWEKLDYTLKYVAMSRGTDINNIYIVDEINEAYKI